MIKTSISEKAAVAASRSTASAMPLIDETTPLAFVFRTAIQLELPGLSPVEQSRQYLCRKVPVRKNKKFASSHKENVAVDPHQLQLAFIDV